MFRDVPECSGMFRHVPECSMFRVLSTLVPEAKDLVVALEKRTISYLSVSARIRVIDPFSQMKREYNTILDDADSANRNNFVPSQSFA